MRLLEVFNWAIGAHKKHAQNPHRQDGNVIVWLNAKEVLPLVDSNFRVSPDSPENHIGNRMSKAEAHFIASNWMDPPDISFNPQSPSHPISFGNGRHRVAALLKLGEEWFPANVDRKSVKQLSKLITVLPQRPNHKT